MFQIFENKTPGGKGDPADLDYVYLAFLNKAITTSEIIEWTERVIRDTEYLLPEIIYNVAVLNKKTATRVEVLDEFQLFPPRTYRSYDYDFVLSRISRARATPYIKLQPRNNSDATKQTHRILRSSRTEVRRFKKVFRGIKL